MARHHAEQRANGASRKHVMPDHFTDRNKDEEELDLEERLFGASKRRKTVPASGAKGQDDSDDDGDDNAISFTVDAPLADVSEDESEDDHRVGATGVESEDEEESEEESGSEDGAMDQDDEDDEDDEEQEDDASSDTSSDSGLSIAAFDNTPPGSTRKPKKAAKTNGQNAQTELSFPEYDAEATEDGPLGTELHSADPLAPSISVPSNIYSEPIASSSRISGAGGAQGSSAESRKGKGKQAVWEDESDRAILVDAEKDRRLKKLARGREGGSELTGAELEKRLREQFEKLHPRPEWANMRTRAGHPSLSLLLSSTKSFIDSGSDRDSAPTDALSKPRRGPLPSGEIKIQKLRNANYQNPTTGKREAKGAGHGVVDLAWHPNPRLSVLAVCGGDRRVRIFNVDGDSNPPLMTLHIPSLPLTKGTFHPSGSSLFLTGPRPYYYTYDLPSQRCLRSPRNLFGSRPSPSAPNSLNRHAFSPDGSLLAVAGLRGAVSVLEWNQGAGAVVAELKSGRGGSVVDLSWAENGKELSVLGGRDGAEVEIWNVGERSVVRRWADSRAYGGSLMRKSRDSSYTALGSNMGIVNLYSSSDLRAPTQKRSKKYDDAVEIPSGRPEPIKSLEHLTTSITSLDFHPEGQMLVTASNGKRDALKLYHLPSATAFSNWPTSTTALGRVTDAKFSSDGQYLSVGNQSGRVGLWRMKHFAPS